MPETPDFDQIAETLARELRSIIFSQESDQSLDHIALRLREIWNARGAADVVKLETELAVLMGGGRARYMQQLDRALRTLDR